MAVRPVDRQDWQTRVVQERQVQGIQEPAAAAALDALAAVAVEEKLMAAAAAAVADQAWSPVQVRPKPQVQEQQPEMMAIQIMRTVPALEELEEVQVLLEPTATLDA